ncbi:hypothetical protein ABG768_012851 [Culter alburnus]|uniref:Uncharacterized protein n=1 Tax=Culter alburnus TaxID=194366 RepID=A0AAW2B3P9_CULAL
MHIETENKTELHKTDTKTSEQVGHIFLTIERALWIKVKKMENEFAAHLCLKRFTLFNDADERYFQKRGHELHLYELLVALREREHSRDSLNNDILTHAPEHGLRVSIEWFSGQYFQAQIVRQEVVSTLPEVDQGAVEGALYPGLLAGRQERTQAHCVPNACQDVTGLGMQMTRVNKHLESDLEPDMKVCQESGEH